MDNNDARLISATDIGRPIGLTAGEVNRLLRAQGFLHGEPGAYGLTPKGTEYGHQQSHSNSYGGYAYRAWETTHFDPSITDVLDASPDRLAELHAEGLAHKEARSAARKIAQSEAEARFQAFQADMDRAEVENEIDAQKMLLVIAGIVVVAAASYGAYKYVQRYQRKRAAREVQ